MALCVAFLLFVTGALIAVNLTPQAAHAAAASTAVTTYRNDNGRTGQYPNETVLNTSNVNQSQFGKRVSYPVDGQVYAQPLYVPNLSIGGSVHNVVFAATENDTVYAFDADATSAGAPLWKTSLLPGGATPVPYANVNCADLTPVIGITGTPVIDPSTNTMYVVSYDDEGGTLVYRLHALNILTGQDISPPIVIQASAPGTGADSSGGMVHFDAHVERQRVGLNLVNGKIYIAFASFCDIGNYHGWILGYSYNGSSFQQTSVYNDTPNGTQGGIWGGDGALTADTSGNLYFVSGNGTFDANTGGSDVGDSFVRLNPAPQVQDYFTPFNQSCLSQGDVDLGSGGPLLVQSANVLTGAGKEGRPYVVNTQNMGQYTADPALNCGSTEPNRTDIDKVQQELPPGSVGTTFSTPGLWNGPNGQFVYFSVVNGPTKAYSLSNGRISATPTSTTSATFGFTGGDAVVSSNGTAPGTGIVWNIGSSSVLHAYDAANLGTELYNSSQNTARDGVNGYVKFSSVAVANGQVFVGLASSVAIFGLLSVSPTPTPTTPTPTPTANPGGVQINAGGPAVAPFVADTGATGGTTVTTTHAVDTSAVTNPAPQAVYQSNRFGTFNYTIPGLTPGASYKVRLHFAETYWTAAGQRTFNVTINGQTALTNFDILATAGAANKAVAQQFTTTADSTGKITIQFTTVKDNAQVNAIEVIPSTAPPPPPGSIQINSGGPAVAPFVADTGATGGTTVTTTHADRHQRRDQSRAPGRLPEQPLRQLQLHHSRPHPRRQLQSPPALRRNLLDRRRPTNLQRHHQRPDRTDQLRHPGHRRGGVQGSGRAVHHRGGQHREDHASVHYCQGQRPGQRHRDSVVRKGG